MTVIYNGWTLKVPADGIEVFMKPVVSEWDAWDETRYKRKQRAFGTYTGWTVQVVEHGTVAWVNSVAGSLQAQAGSLLSGSLVFNEGDLYSGTFTAYVRGLEWHFEDRNRYITVDFQAE